MWDLFTVSMTAFLMVATLASFQVDSWSSPGELGRLLIVLFVFGMALLPMVYVFSFYFANASNGMFVLVFLNFVSGNF